MNTKVSNDTEQFLNFLNKINPNDMFYRAKMIEKLKMNEFQEWIQK